MRTSTLTAIAAAVLAGGTVGLLAGCTTPAPEASVSPAATPSARPSDTLPPGATGATGARAPLGLEVRYVDADGKFQAVAPKDFRR